MSQFEEVFANRVVELASDNESRISKLENDVKLLKTILNNMDVQTYKTIYGAGIESSIMIRLSTGNVKAFLCNISNLELCDKCNLLLDKDDHHSHVHVKD